MKLEPGHRYRMPVFFGPAPGPRQMPEGRADPHNSPRRTLLTLTCIADRAALELLLPPRFTLWGEPMLVVELQNLKNIDWLAGRGYNTLGVKIPVEFAGREGARRGQLLTVLWENLADPIITGREELGFSKVYCEIPDVPFGANRFEIACDWMSFEFCRLSVDGLVDTPIADVSAVPPVGEGVFHFRYFPRGVVRGEAEIAQVTFTPAANANARVISRQTGMGRFAFRRARWEDLPTLHHIVDFFGSLELRQLSRASIVRSEGGKDLSDTVCLD